jgi:hypothetical protein
MKRTLGDQFAAGFKNIREEFWDPDRLKISYQYAQGLCLETHPSKATRINPGAISRRVEFSAKDMAQIPVTAVLVLSDSEVAISAPFCGDGCELGGLCNWIFCSTWALIQSQTRIKVSPPPDIKVL